MPKVDGAAPQTAPATRMLPAYEQLHVVALPTHPGEKRPAIRSRPANSAEYLVEIVQRLSMARSLASVMSIVRTAARELTGADGASFVLRDGEMCYYADEDSIGPLWKGQRFPINICISGWVMNHRTPVAIADIYQDPRIPADVYRLTYVRSLAMVPIRTHDPVGAIGNYWATSYTPTPDQIRLLQALADSTAVAMENIRVHQELEERVRQRTEELEAANSELRSEAAKRATIEAKVRHLSLTDELTGLSNRRGFLLRAEQQLQLVHRLHTNGWILYVDLDGLKQVNDLKGHEAGDNLIRSAARVLRESFRESDILGRIGGDEFVVFATSTAAPIDEMRARLERTVDHYNLHFPTTPPLAMSIGAVRCDPHSTDSLEDLIHQADAAMYIEKRRKRARLQDEARD